MTLSAPVLLGDQNKLVCYGGGGVLGVFLFVWLVFLLFPTERSHMNNSLKHLCFAVAIQV